MPEEIPRFPKKMPSTVHSDSRVAELLSRFSDPEAGAAYWLCDCHDPLSVAHTLVAMDLTATDLTYGALRAESTRLAASLAGLGVRRGDRVATLMGKRREYLVTLISIWRLGAVHVPLFTAFAPPAIALRLLASNAKYVICDETQRPKLSPGETMPSNPPWKVITTGEPDANALSYSALMSSSAGDVESVNIGGNDPIIQIYTSGTTGIPKGVLVPLRAVAGFQIYGEYGLNLRADDVFWNAADPGWGYGLYFGIIVSLATGVRSVLLDSGFSVEKTYAVLSNLGVTNFTTAPTVYRSLRASAIPPPSGLKLRHLSSAGEPLTPDVIEWSAKVLGSPVHDHYGQTETGMTINNHHHPDLRKPIKAGSMGCSAPGWKAVILKPDADELALPGEVGRAACEIAQSPLAWFDQYLGDPERSAGKFSANGRWFITGDMARVDEDGYFFFSSRDDDVIIMAGYRIGPFEVESVLAMHPAVRECAATAAPDEVRGEVLESFVVLREGYVASSELTAELQIWVKERFAAHAYPRRVHYVDCLPKTPSGKIQRFILRNQLRESRQKEVAQASQHNSERSS